MNQQKFIVAYLLIAMSLLDIKQQRVECVFAGSGRYGYGKKETKSISRQIICKHWKACCGESLDKKREHSLEEVESSKTRYQHLKEYLRAIEKKMRRREKYLKWQEMAAKST